MPPSQAAIYAHLYLESTDLALKMTFFKILNVIFSYFSQICVKFCHDIV